MQSRDFDQLNKAQSAGEAVQIKDVTESYGCLVVTGPKARELLSTTTKADLSNATFPWMSAREIDIAGVATLALRVSYAGELGWELYPPIEQMLKVYDAVMAAGAPLGVTDFGMYALNSLRMEKAYRGFGWELSNELTLIEADMERFIAFGKGEFSGRAALLARKQQGSKWQLAYLRLDVSDRDVLGSEPIYQGEKIAGVVTSGCYGHATGQNLAFAYVDPSLASPGTTLEIEMLGSRYACTVLAEPVYDPKNERLRA